jgi:hypothetical protein
MKQFLQIFTIFITFCLSSPLYGSAEIRQGSLGYSNGDGIILRWSTGKEENIKNFIIERKSVNGNFAIIDRVKATGNNSEYSYEDKNVYKTSGEIFVYRISVEENDGSISGSINIIVNHDVSSVKRTWGMIKSMFR